MHHMTNILPAACMYNKTPSSSFVRIAEALIYWQLDVLHMYGMYLRLRCIAQPISTPPAIPCPTQVYGPENLAPLPGSPDPANPTKWVQVGGDPVSFDAVTGARISSPPGSAALFALTEGFYFCMLVESDGEAALFDAPEGTLNKKLQLNYSHLNIYDVERYEYKYTGTHYDITAVHLSWTPRII